MGRPRKQLESVHEMAARILTAVHRTESGEKTTLRAFMVTRVLHDLASRKAKPSDVTEMLSFIDSFDARREARVPQEVEARRQELSDHFSRGSEERVHVSPSDVYLSSLDVLGRRLFGWLAYTDKLRPCAQWTEATDLLHQVAMGQQRRVVINLPPQSLKTFLCSVTLPVATLLQRPSARILVLVQSDEAADSLRSIYDRLAESLPPDIPSEGKLRCVDGIYINTVGGGVQIAKFGRSVAENDFDLCVLDDPQTPQDVRNSRLRDRDHDAANSYVAGKLAAKGCAVLVQSRLHVEDLSGRLSTTVALAAAEGSQPARSAGWFRYFRPAAWQPGAVILNGLAPPEVLCSELFNAAQLYELFEEVGAAEFSARWLQNPLPEVGPPATYEVCLQIMRDGNKKYAQESTPVPIPPDQLIRYQTFGLADAWVMPENHPHRLSQKERQRNLQRQEEYLGRLKASTITRSEFDAAVWHLK